MKKKSFFERLTGGVNLDDEYEEEEEEYKPTASLKVKETPDSSWVSEEPQEGELTVDVFQTPTSIVIKTLVAGVKRDDLDISISRDMVTIRGKREEERNISESDYFHKELYWGSFSRTVLLPTEIDIEAAEATENLGMLTIRLPKIDKEKQTKLKVMRSAN